MICKLIVTSWVQRYIFFFIPPNFPPFLFDHHPFGDGCTATSHTDDIDTATHTQFADLTAEVSTTGLECADIVHSVNGHICADGGIVDVGDICKAFCLNADFVMAGGMFAGTDEAEGEIIEKQYQTNEIENDKPKIIIKQFKQYYGMSSEYANNKFAGGMCNYKTSEGRELLIPYTGSIAKILQDISGGIASCCTYIGASSIKNMSKCATLIKVHNQLNRVFEKYSV